MTKPILDMTKPPIPPISHWTPIQRKRKAWHNTHLPTFWAEVEPGDYVRVRDGDWQLIVRVRRVARIIDVRPFAFDTD